MYCIICRVCVCLFLEHPPNDVIINISSDEEGSCIVIIIIIIIIIITRFSVKRAVSHMCMVKGRIIYVALWQYTAYVVCRFCDQIRAAT